MTEPVWHTLEYVVSWARPWDGLFLAEVLRGDAPVLSPTQGTTAAAASSAVLLVRRHGQRAAERQHVRRAVTR